MQTCRRSMRHCSKSSTSTASITFSRLYSPLLSAHASLFSSGSAMRSSRQNEGSGAAKERLSGVRELGTLHEREESKFVEEVGKRGDQVHIGSRQAAVESIKPHRQAAMPLSLWGFALYMCKAHDSLKLYGVVALFSKVLLAQEKVVEMG